MEADVLTVPAQEQQAIAGSQTDPVHTVSVGVVR